MQWSLLSELLFDPSLECIEALPKLIPRKKT